MKRTRPDIGPHMGRLRSWFEYVPIRAIQLVLRLLSRRTALRLGRWIGFAAYLLDARHRRVALQNLADSLPGLRTAKDRRRVARRCFEHFGAVGVECLLLPYRRPEEADGLAVWEGLDHLRKAHLKGHGVFVTSGHLGNWEMVALMQGWRGIPMSMVTRPLDNPLLEEMLARGRTMSGNEILHKQRAVRGMLQALRARRSIALVIDQDFPRSDRIFVDFFGRPAATAPTLGLLAVRTRAPIVPVVSELLSDGRYRIRYLAPLEWASTGDREADVLDIMSRCTALLEEAIRRNPEQWLWMHRRWKTRPKPGKPRRVGRDRSSWNQTDAEPSSSTGTAR